MFLHANEDKTTANNEADRKIVDYWYNALIDIDPEDCTVDYLYRVTEDYEQQNTMNNTNFKFLYTVFRKIIIGFCDAHFSDLPSKLASRLTDDKLLGFMIDKRSDNQSPSSLSSSSLSPRTVSDGDLATALCESLIAFAHGGATGSTIIDAWEKGPCKIFLNTLSETEMLPYDEFIQLALDRKKNVQYCTEATQVWIRAVDICNTIDDWVTAYAADRTIAPNLRHTLRSLVGQEANMKRTIEVESSENVSNKRNKMSD